MLALQLDYALGICELAEAAFQIVAEKTTDQLLVSEYLLEMAPVGILLQEEI